MKTRFKTRIQSKSWTNPVSCVLFGR